MFNVAVALALVGLTLALPDSPLQPVFIVAAFVCMLMLIFRG